MYRTVEFPATWFSLELCWWDLLDKKYPWFEHFSLLVNTTLTNQAGFTTPTPQKILHNNICILLRNGLIIDPFSCAHYLSCSNSQTIRRKCQEGLLFNAKLLRCDYPENVNCSRSTPSNTITTPLNKCKYLPNGLTKDPLSCAHFFICSGGNSYRFQCPAGLLFNPTALVCDYAINANCWWPKEKLTVTSSIFFSITKENMYKSPY